MRPNKLIMKRIITWIILIFPISYISCKKYLDTKPIKTLVVPTNLSDIQSILDNSNYIIFNAEPALELPTDNYYVTTANWQARGRDERLNYIWDKDATYLNSWSVVYQGPIFYSNFSLDNLSKIGSSENPVLFNTLKGSALFYRAFAFQQLSQVYCKPYSSTSSSDLGIVLRLTSNINAPIKRSSVQSTYDQIISDLKTAIQLLPSTTSYPTRPNKAAAYGLLARTFLSMRDYENAGLYADSCLKGYNTLMDYNNVTNPFPVFNTETIFYTTSYSDGIFTTGRALTDSNLYQSYAANDLRKLRFFKNNNNGTYSFNGSYYGSVGYIPFCGIATDEIYLIRAECFARAGNKDAALNDLNTLLIKRWKTGTFTPLTAVDADDAKGKILIERRKELIWRGLRWSDVRRLNLENANISLTRVINGTTYILPPNDLRTVWLIPVEEINSSGIEQNPR